MTIPLPEKIRPKDLKNFIGQEHLVGKDGLITKLLKSESGSFPSLIFWGPPGVGKTTLARIIASQLKRDFYEFSAVNTSTKEIQAVIASETKQSGPDYHVASAPRNDKLFPAPLVFIDEIHRFNKAQQDKLLPFVERGDILLIGATTENPSFEVIGPLLSRSRVVVMEQHSEADLKKILSKGLKTLNKTINPKAKKFLIESSNGDARVMLNVTEIAANLANTPLPFPSTVEGNGRGRIHLSDIEQSLQRRQLSFDKNGEEHYNVISAFIKSMRASNVDASLYYLARMVEAGQDPLYIARRMVVFASEDIGMAQPTALVVANEVFRACETIGYPECSINLAHGVVYLAKARKNRSAYDGLRAAQADVRKYGNLPVPLKIRNAPTKLMKELDYGKGYEMYDKGSLLPDKIKNKKYYKD